jgi:transposase
MPKCKKCNSVQVTKSGKANGKQRYYCKVCGCHFTEGDGRTNEQIAAKKAMCVVLYSLGKISFRTLAKTFNTSPSLTYRWIVEAGSKIPHQKTSGEVKQMEIDEAWHFIRSKAAAFESSKPVTVAAGEMGLGYSAIVILQHSGNNH